MNPLSRGVVTRWGAGAAAVFAALALTGLPAYAEDPLPDPSPSAEPSPSPAPSESPRPSESPTPSQSPEPSDSPEPSGSPSTSPELPPPPSPEPDGTEADLDVWVPSSFVPVDSGIKVFRIDLRNNGPQRAENVTLTIDATELRDDVEVDFADNCKVAGRVARCSLDAPMPVTGTQLLTFGLTAPKGTPQGKAGTVTVSVHSSTEDPEPFNNQATTEVRVVQKSADLVAVGEDLPDFKPGSVRTVEFAMLNSSKLTAKDVVLFIGLPLYMSFHHKYDNCRYYDQGHSAECRFEGEIPPYHFWTVSDETPITVKLAKNAPGPFRLGAVTVMALEVDQIDEPVSGHVARGAVSEVSGLSMGDPDGVDSAVDLLVTTSSNPADLSAVGAAVSGQVGDTVPVKLGEKNHGPADTVPPGLVNFSAAVTVTVPDGTDVVAAHQRCYGVSDGKIDWAHPGRAGAREYWCDHTRHVMVGETVLFDFKLKITKASVGTGTVTVDGGKWDDTLSNNTAPLTVKLTTGGGGGGGGLPVTGTPLAGLVGGGAAAVLLGLALYLVGRWRRTPTAVVAAQTAA